jgi:hypothetical protein
MTCHSARVLYRLAQDVVLRGGTSTSGSTLVKQGENVACTVACHFPFVATPALRGSVTWTSAPLACISCHAEVNRPGSAAAQGGSAHDPIFADARAAVPEQTTCWSCHDDATQPAAHLGGDPKLVDPAAMSAVCISCHSGQGQVLHRASPADEQTPPLLLGWTDAVRGDFHGARAGTGYGGTLKAPYVRGQPPLPCTACHAGHASANAFLLAPVVNGTPIPAGAIDRRGIGAERLCEACHEGERHGTCKGCHTDQIICPQGQCYMDPTATPVDPAPAGSACFWCHGHEGILQWTAPGSDMNLPWRQDCTHCHGFAQPPTRFAPPVIAAGRLSTNAPASGTPQPPALLGPGATVLVVTQTSATVYWETDVNATTWVAYGLGSAGTVVGSPDTSCGTTCPGRYHRVVLTGLAPGTTYQLRVRSSDDFRNQVVSPLQSFTTLGPLTPPAPVPLHAADVWLPWVDAGSGTGPAMLAWNPVAAPGGNAVEYRVLFSQDPTFAVGVVDSGWIPGTSFDVTVFGDAWGNATQYFWRVEARDSVTGDASPWSTSDSFYAGMVNPYLG